MVRQALKRNLLNFLGKRTNRKLLVIESDDWGAVRMPSREVYQKLVSRGVVDGNDPFARFDGLASEDDFSHLFETLGSVKDKNGNRAVITANCVVANPDFERIKAGQFQQYFCEPIQETYKRYPRHQNSFSLWEEGMRNKLFFPQYHSREHVNVIEWMRLLRRNEVKFREAFDYGTYALNASIVASLKVHTQQDQEQVNDIIEDGLIRFQRLFGYNPTSFIAPNYTWNGSIEEVLNRHGVRFLQGSKRQNVPVIGSPKLGVRYHFCGQRNQYGQLYLVRNCLFEPSISPSIDYVSVCLRQVDNAFFWNTPAIIGTHRLNYIGFLDEKNRNRNLKHLRTVLQAVVKRHPDAEFVTTAELGGILSEA